MPKNASLSERFWEKVNKNGPDECWPWTGGATPEGYGRFGIGNKAMCSSTHFSWELHHGSPVPDGLWVLHRCDNPPCVNPAHLFVGTQLDNMRDRNAKGRANLARGERAGRVKLTEADVRKIRAGGKPRDLAAHFGVNESTISDVRTGRSWKHLPLLMTETSPPHCAGVSKAPELPHRPRGPIARTPPPRPSCRPR